MSSIKIYEIQRYVSIIIIIIIVHHKYGLDRPVSSSPISLFQGLSSRLRQFGLQYSSIFKVLLFLIFVTCCSQLGLHLLSMSSAGSTFNSSKISSFFCGQKGYLLLKFTKHNRMSSIKIYDIQQDVLY